MKRLCLAWTAACLALAVATPVRAALLEAEGVASIDKAGIDYARHAATEDALRRLSLQMGAAIVNTDQINSRGVDLQSGTVRPAARINRYHIAQEWREGSNLHVLVRADDRAQGAMPVLQQEYRKKVAVTPFHVSNPLQVGDIDDITRGMARTLSEWLAQSGKFQSRVSNFIVPLEGREANAAQIAAVVRQIAADNDSQFVLTGTVADIGQVTQTRYFIERASRNVEVHARLYDGLTGTLIAEHRLHQSASGNLTVGRERPFGSAAFFATDVGKAIHQVLNTLTDEVVADLKPLPFTAKIIRVDQRKVVFDAGATSAVQPGDRLIAFAKKEEWHSDTPSRGALGILENPVATIAVVQVHPGFSIGELPTDQGQAMLNVGDYVRFLPGKGKRLGGE